MKTSKTKKNDSSAFEAKRATLSSVPASVSRHRNPKMSPASGKAMRGGKYKK